MPFCLVTGTFIPEKSNIWRDCVDGYVDWVAEHLEDGAPLDQSDACGDPPLVLAAGAGSLACVQLLVEAGADLEQRNVMGESPLVRAAHNGHLAVCRCLLDEGADVNAVDRADNTALHWAAMRGHVEVVRLLLDRGGSKVATNAQGRLPVDQCRPEWSAAWRYTREALQ